MQKAQARRIAQSKLLGQNCSNCKYQSYYSSVGTICKLRILGMPIQTTLTQQMKNLQEARVNDFYWCEAYLRSSEDN